MPAKRAQFSIMAAGTPSSSMRWPSLMKAPQTREVKKPRLSFTTIGVLRIFCTKSMARASVSGEVFLPTMISTSGIFSTGEKKCRPMNWSGRDDASARPVIGKVEVLEANTASLGSAASAFLVASALTSRFSNTASTTSWQSFSAPKSGVAVTLAEQRVALVLVEPAALHQLVELVGDVRLALVGRRPGRGRPARCRARPATETVAMPEPIRPAPRMPIFLYSCFGTPLGRRASLFASCRPKNSVRIMLLATGLRSSETK